MCGICGLVSLDGATAPDPAALAAMNDTLVHRGPDSEGSMIDGPCGLAMRRLSIIDLAGGDQPIANEDGRIQVIQNGEIYNYRELMDGLSGQGHTFRTHSDTEVLVHLYEERGPSFVEALRGMFAIAIWDARHGRLVLARDRFGIKPLYYRRADGQLSFASELKALLRQPGFSREIDPQALESFLAFNSVPAPLTIFSEARKLPPGHTLVAERGEVTLERYARPTPVPEGEVRTESEEVLAEELRERLRDSVRAHLVSDVPVGVLLSGGVDSAALTALAAGESGYRVSTFSIGFEESSFDELDQARLVAKRYGTDHHELILRPDAVELLPKLVEAFDEPFGDSSALPTYLVSQLAADTVKVVLSGEGGDELFGGYYTYVADRLAPRVGRAAPFLRPLVELLPSSSGKVSFDYKAKRFMRGAHLPPVERHHAWKEIFSPEAQEELLSQPRISDPLDALPRPLRRDRGRPGARPVPGPRPRHLPRRRPAGEDRPGQHGPLAGGARPLPRPGGGRARAGARDQAEGPGLLQEAPAPPGGRAAGAQGDHPRAQAGLLDPGRGLAPRRPRAVRARCALARDDRASGVPEPGGGDEGARRSHLRQGGPEPPDLGAAQLHPLVRPLRAEPRRQAGAG